MMYGDDLEESTVQSQNPPEKNIMREHEDGRDCSSRSGFNYKKLWFG